MISLATLVFSVALQPSPAIAQVRAPIPVVQVAESWDDLSPSQRDRALKNYQRYMDLPQEKRHDIDRRYEKWKNLPPVDQERFRKKHQGLGLVDD